MNPIWKIHQFLKKRLPKKAIKRLRYVIESQTNFLWRKESYSQFAEDVVLVGLMESRSWNAETQMSDIGRKKGFYVDVGACAPKQFSNTYAFYRKGWRGINIDATPGSMKIFSKVRKRDINIEAAYAYEQVHVAKDDLTS